MWWQRQTKNWVYATPPVALLLIGLAPFMDAGPSLALFLSLPVYMLHQYEEHDADRFRAYVNAMVPEGRTGLQHQDVWAINVILVWFLLLGVFWLAAASAGWAVLAAYLLLINGIVHILPAVIRRQSNPGVITAVALFLPLSIWILASHPATTAQHVISIALIIALHVAIVARALRKQT
ncbi:MAG: HXXEE domain-containing protein [Pseudomonadota bacterium]